MAGWQTDQRIFATQKIKQGLRLVLCEIAYSMSIHSSQCTFHGFYQRHLSNEKRPLLWTSCTVGAYLVSNFQQGTCALTKNRKNWFQTGLTHPFRWMSGKSKKVEAAGRGPFLFPTYLGRSKGLCSQGMNLTTTNTNLNITVLPTCT